MKYVQYSSIVKYSFYVFGNYVYFTIFLCINAFRVITLKTTVHYRQHVHELHIFYFYLKNNFIVIDLEM